MENPLIDIKKYKEKKIDVKVTERTSYEKINNMNIERQ